MRSRIQSTFFSCVWLLLWTVVSNSRSVQAEETADEPPQGPGANFGVVQLIDVSLLKKIQHPDLATIRRADAWSRLEATLTYIRDLQRVCVQRQEIDDVTVCEIHSLQKPFQKRTATTTNATTPMAADATTKKNDTSSSSSSSSWASLSTSTCANLDPLCTLWAARGDCESNRNKMADQCAAACMLCFVYAAEETRRRRPPTNPKQQQQHLPDSPSSSISSIPKRQDELLQQLFGIYDKTRTEHAGADQLKESRAARDSSTVVGLSSFPATISPDDGTAFGVAQRMDGLMVGPAELQAKIAETARYMQRLDGDAATASQGANANPKQLLLSSCRNLDPLCTFWALRRECEHNRLFVTQRCAPACQTCHLLLEENNNNNHANLKDDKLGDQRNTPKTHDGIHQSGGAANDAKDDGPGSAFGVVQDMGEDTGGGGGVDSPVLVAKLEETRRYMETVVWNQPAFRNVVCRNQFPECTRWAVEGECHTNPQFMRIQACAPACQSCDRLLFA
ncbi:hypothetical protein ACA910_013790 [Epithemia clementina (nom. ined.)]